MSTRFCTNTKSSIHRSTITTTQLPTIDRIHVPTITMRNFITYVQKPIHPSRALHKSDSQTNHYHSKWFKQNSKMSYPSNRKTSSNKQNPLLQQEANKGYQTQNTITKIFICWITDTEIEAFPFQLVLRASNQYHNDIIKVSKLLVLMNIEMIRHQK